MLANRKGAPVSTAIDTPFADSPDSSPSIHQWLALTNMVGMANPPAFAMGIAIIETLAALALIFGVLSNAAFIGTAMLSFGIWSGAEAFHLPFKSGMTDLGPSVGYIFASLALFFAAAGSTWSVDSWLRPRLGRFAWLAAPAVEGTSADRLVPAPESYTRGT
jgi:uncharacterized membrane protein YphA (DoxX/SURF4 family)